MNMAESTESRELTIEKIWNHPRLEAIREANKQLVKLLLERQASFKVEENPQ